MTHAPSGLKYPAFTDDDKTALRMLSGTTWTTMYGSSQGRILSRLWAEHSQLVECGQFSPSDEPWMYYYKYRLTPLGEAARDAVILHPNKNVFGYHYGIGE